jgi:hypothetical protein
MVDTRAVSRKQGSEIVRRAIRHDLVPELNLGLPLTQQTAKTRWALHVLAVMSKQRRPRIEDVRRVLAQTADLF